MNYWHSANSTFQGSGLLVRVLACALSSGACTGQLLSDGAERHGSPPPGYADANSGERPTVKDPTNPGQVARALDPKRESGLQRLSTSQYLNTVADLFSPGVAAELELELDYRGKGFTSIGGREVAISRSGVRKYEGAARLVAARVVADASLRLALSGCSPAGVADAACCTSFVAATGRRLFRRPLSNDETQRYAEVGRIGAQAFGDFWQGARLALTGMLLSPHFLYQVEIGVERDGERLLSDFELATRLSYFLWDSAPDEQLLAAASRGELSTNAASQRARLLSEDSRLGRGVRAFAEGLLALHRLDLSPQSEEVFPQATPTLYAAMKEAVQLLTFDAVMQRKSFLSILDPGFAYVNAALAPFYGVAPPASGFSKVALTQDSARVGLLTEPAILAATSRATETSPTLRGIFVTELLCHETPPPPADVNANLPERQTGVSRREQLERHMSQPACAGCHQTIDPIGFGLERFDALGQEQLDDSGVAPSSAGGYFQTPFDGARELSQLVKADPRLATCIARKAYMHGLSRLPEAAEDVLIAPLADNFVAGGHDLAALLGAVAESGMFQLAPKPSTP